MTTRVAASLRRPHGRRSWLRVAGALSLACTLAACLQKEKLPMSNDLRNADDPLLAAVYYRDPAGVRKLLADGHPPDRSKQGQPLIVATSSDQFVIAELLLRAGADPYHVDEFGVGALEFIASSREPAGTADGQARLRILELLKSRGVAVPPPGRAQILELKRQGLWPPRR